MPDNRFLTDVQKSRARARELIGDRARAAGYVGDVDTAVALLQKVVATELVCVLRYSMDSIAAVGIHSASVSSEFAERAEEERHHMMTAANCIGQPGGIPDFASKGLATRSASEHRTAARLLEMVTGNFVAEHLVIAHYRGLITHFGVGDPSARTMLEPTIPEEEDHATDMHDLLVAHQGRPFPSVVR